jgi:hypothetical protein
MTSFLPLGTRPVNGGAGRPKNRVTAKSKLPQKKYTGLHLPMKPVRHCLSTRSACSSTREKRWA